MVKENEIRFGNWFHHKDDWSYRQPDQDYKEFDFQWMPEDWYAVGECRLDLDVVSPIELTEEWLIKFGFDIEWTVGGFLKWEKQMPYEEKFKLLDRRLPHPQYHEPKAIIQYVHQLQNLFFSLTGRELELTK